jgi:hypothetical protein
MKSEGKNIFVKRTAQAYNPEQIQKTGTGAPRCGMKGMVFNEARERGTVYPAKEFADFNHELWGG